MPYCACENNEWKTKGWPDILKNAPVGCEGVICGIAGEWTLPHRLHGVALSSLLRLPESESGRRGCFLPAFAWMIGTEERGARSEEQSALSESSRAPFFHPCFAPIMDSWGPWRGTIADSMRNPRALCLLFIFVNRVSQSSRLLFPVSCWGISSAVRPDCGPFAA
jgi:hypothetical protein